MSTEDGKVQFRGKSVSNKRANKPFMVQEKYKAAQLRKKELLHDEEVEEGGLLATILYFIVVGLVFSALGSKAITGTWLWNQGESKWLQKRTWFPLKQQTFTPEELALYNGSDPTLPLYLAIQGDVFDVSTNRRVYGPGGSYGHFAGVDGTRAFHTGCFKTHLTHDIRDFDEKGMKSIDHWHKFFLEHEKYFKVGQVLNRPIPEDAPIPEPCKTKKAKPT